MHEPPLDDWDDLRVLLAVLRAGSFTAAATRLGVEQSTISRRIAGLEARLGRPLFTRDRRGPRPTDLGERLRAHAERVEREVHGLLDVVGSHERAVEGRVRLALTEALAAYVVIPKVLPALRRAHPGLFVDLVTSDENADLAAREADLALRFARPTRGDAVAQRVGTVTIGPIASKQYARKRRSVEALDWIVYERWGRSDVEGAHFDAHVHAQPVLRCNGYLACVEAVRAGLGVSLLATDLCEHDRSLRVLDLGLPSMPALELWLVAPTTLRTVPRVDAVWNALLTALARPKRKTAR
jgi:DNA-binding transcriptional LysR family regulator